MRQSWAVAGLTVCLLVGQADAADQAEKEGAAKSKAGVLEENASVKGGKAPPAPAETISRTEAQAVDPIGEEPLDGAITCLAPTIYWETKGEGNAGMQAVAKEIARKPGSSQIKPTVPSTTTTRDQPRAGRNNTSGPSESAPMASTSRPAAIRNKRYPHACAAVFPELSSLRELTGACSTPYFAGEACSTHNS